MAFTDVEMAILSQCAYCQYPDSVHNESLHRFLTHNKKYLNEKLGPGYSDALQALIDKVAGQPYTIVQTRDDNEGTGFAAFAVADPNNEVTVACRGTEFDKLSALNDEGKAVLALLVANGISGNKLLNTALIYQVLTEQGMLSEGMDDIIADIQLAFRTETEQQEQMAKFVELLEQPGYNGYYFTGHSLGGNLAMYGAIALNDKAKLKDTVTFNAPGFNSLFWEENAALIDQVASGFRTYQNEWDAISECFEVPGNIIVLDCKDEDTGGLAHGFNQLIPSEDGSFVMAPDGIKKSSGWGKTFAKVSSFGDWLSYTWHNTKHNIQQSVNGVFGSTIRVPISELQEYARKLQGYADDSADVFDRIYNSLTSLRENKQWQGMSLEAVVAATQSNRQKFEETLDELQSLAAFLKKFADEMEAKDEEIRRKIVAV